MQKKELKDWTSDEFRIDAVQMDPQKDAAADPFEGKRIQMLGDKSWDVQTIRLRCAIEGLYDQIKIKGDEGGISCLPLEHACDDLGSCLVRICPCRCLAYFMPCLLCLFETREDYDAGTDALGRQKRVFRWL